VVVKYINPETGKEDATKYPQSYDKFLSTFSKAISIREENSFTSDLAKLKCTNYAFYCQNDWCEVLYLVNCLMGKCDRNVTQTKVTILFTDGDKQFVLDDNSTSDIVIIANTDPNGYCVRVAQKGTECFVEMPMPIVGYVIPEYQMRDFMTTLIVQSYKCYRNCSEAMGNIEA